MRTILKSRRECPPNGFIYRQPQTGWELNTWDFENLCQELLKHRRSNPQFKLSLDIDKIRDEVDHANAVRVSTIPGAEIYLSQEGGQAYALKKVIPQRLLDVAEKVRLLSSGRSLISEWKASGYDVVTSIESNRRAAICAECPKNEKGDFTSWFTVPASEHIRKEIEEVQQHGLSTESDEKLGVCKACLCPLKVKVHCELPLIQKHMLPETKSKLWEGCWIPKG